MAKKAVSKKRKNSIGPMMVSGKQGDELDIRVMMKRIKHYEKQGINIVFIEKGKNFETWKKEDAPDGFDLIGEKELKKAIEESPEDARPGEPEKKEQSKTAR